MREKRQFERYRCALSVDMDIFEGNPDDIDINTATPLAGKGIMLDVSRGGTFIVTGSRVGISMPIRLHVSVKSGASVLGGTIVRTGLLKNNPSEIVKKYASLKIKEDAYIAVKFDSPLENVDEYRK
jgi:hypothetical protein